MCNVRETKRKTREKASEGLAQLNAKRFGFVEAQKEDMPPEHVHKIIRCGGCTSLDELGFCFLWVGCIVRDSFGAQVSPECAVVLSFKIFADLVEGSSR